MGDNNPVSTDLHNKMYTCSVPINYFTNLADSSIPNQWDHRWSAHSPFSWSEWIWICSWTQHTFCSKDRVTKKVFLNLADWWQTVKGPSPFPVRPTGTFLLILINTLTDICLRWRLELQIPHMHLECEGLTF